MKVKALTTKGKIVAGEIYQVVVNYHDIYELLTQGKYSAEDFEIIPEKSDVLSVTARQLRTALLISGVTTDMIKNRIATITNNTNRERLLIALEYSRSYDRDDVELLKLFSLLNLTVVQIDALFDLAATL